MWQWQLLTGSCHALTLLWLGDFQRIFCVHDNFSWLS